MNHLHHHPDGLIYLRTDVGTYVATLVEFAQDYGTPFPSLPAGFTERYYKPGKKHNVQNERGVEGLPLQWPEGDAILAAFGTLMAARTARLNPPKTPEQIKSEASAAVQVRIQQIEKTSLRAMREALLSIAPPSPALTQLEIAEAAIAAERAKITA